MNPIDQLLRDLEAAGIHHRLERIREGTIGVLVTVPGERWEIEVFTTGEVEVEVVPQRWFDPRRGRPHRPLHPLHGLTELDRAKLARRDV